MGHLEVKQSVHHCCMGVSLDGVCAGVLTSCIERLEGICRSLVPGNALTIVSAVRCVNVYLERLGALALKSQNSQLEAVLVQAFESGQFVSVQTSLLAAAAYQNMQERKGVLPAWPTALAELTGLKGALASPESDFGRALVMMRAFVSNM